MQLDFDKIEDTKSYKNTLKHHKQTKYNYII